MNSTTLKMQRAVAAMPKRSAVVVKANSDKATFAAAFAAATITVMQATVPLQAVAVPQTSVCAVKACDGADFSNKDLRKEFYTKGSLKGANFSGSNLQGVDMFGANLEDAIMVGTDMTNADLGQANMDGADLTDAVLVNAIVSRVDFKNAKIENADFTGAIIRKDINDRLCKTAKGTNSKTGEDTRESLMCY